MPDDTHELAAQKPASSAQDRLRARDALLPRDSDALVRIGSFVWEPPTSLSWSDDFFRMIGFEPGAVEPSPELFYSMVHHEDVEGVLEAAKAATEDGLLPEVVYRVVRRDTGEIRFLRGSGCVYRRADGSVHRIIGSVLDVTDSKRATLALEQARAVSRAAEELSSSGSFVVQLRPFELSLSEGLRRLTGLPERNLDHTAGLDVLHREDHERVYEWWMRLFVTRRPESIQLRMQRPGGEARYLYLRASAMPFTSDGVERVVGAAIDITERVQLEADLQRVAKLEAVGTLAAGVAHDFNNYLMIVNAALEHLPRATAESQMRLLGNARHAVSRCVELTRQLLGFARCQPFAPGLIDVRDVLDGLQDLLRQSVGRRAELQIQTPDSPLSARLDAQHLEQMLANLIVNAADAIEASGIGRGEVRIVADHVELQTPLASTPDVVPAGCYTRICVEDDGGGVAPEHLPRIFEPYFTTKPRGRGTGLGLSAVYGIAHQNGGLVTVETREGGTRFALWFVVPSQQPD